MKKPSLLEKLNRFFNWKLKRQEARRKQLKLLLKKLKKEESELKAKLARKEEASRKEHMERQVKVLHQQRKKGIALLRELGR